MPPFVLIGLAAGLACAALFASATAGGMGGRLLLFFLAPMPAFLAGLGWGPASAAIAAIAAALGVGLLINITAGAMVLLTHGLPTAYLCYLVQLNRPGTAGAAGVPATPIGEPATPVTGGPPASSGQTGVEWYPVGRLVAMSALIAGALALLSLLQLGTDLDEVRKLLRELLDKVFLKQLPGFKDRKIEEPEIKLLTEVALYAFPAAAALSWLGGFLLNLYVAGRITLASGRLARSWPDLGAMTFPRGLGFALAVSLIGTTVLTDYPALIASGFAGALFLAYVVLGLAILHELTRGHAARPFILWGVYLALLILNPWAGVAVALIGILEPLLPWRRRHRAAPPSPGGGPGTG